RAERQLDDGVAAVAPRAIAQSTIVLLRRDPTRRSEHERELIGQVDEAIDQLERRVIRPMNAVDGENDRPLSAETAYPRGIGLPDCGAEGARRAASGSVLLPARVGRDQ